MGWMCADLSMRDPFHSRAFWTETFPGDHWDPDGMRLCGKLYYAADFGLVAAHISLALLPVYLFGVLALMVVMHEKLVRKLRNFSLVDCF